MNKKYLIVLIGILAILLICCCLITGLVVLGRLADTSEDVRQFDDVTPVAENRLTPLPTDDIWQLPGPSDEPTEEAWQPETWETESDVPIGGLGDDVLRRDVWESILSVTACETVTASDVVIVVDDFEALAESWFLYCQEGDTEQYVIVYQELPGGGVDFVIGRVREE